MNLTSHRCARILPRLYGLRDGWNAVSPTGEFHWIEPSVVDGLEGFEQWPGPVPLHARLCPVCYRVPGHP